MMIAVIDYGMGNLHSVSKALERLGYSYQVTDDPQVILSAQRLILPGVGAFADAIARLQQTGLTAVLREAIARDKPLLGICLGMQLLFDSSEEGGYHRGLGFLRGRVHRLPVRVNGEKYKVPHMGWNRLHLQQADHLLVKGITGGYTYFVHSYYVAEMDERQLIAYADYGRLVPAIVGEGNVFGMQFHPEKSGATGMKLLQHFCELQCSGKGLANG